MNWSACCCRLVKINQMAVGGHDLDPVEARLLGMKRSLGVLREYIRDLGLIQRPMRR